MARVLTQTSEIQAYLDEVLSAEEARSANLKKQIDDLNHQLNEKRAIPEKIAFSSDVIIHFGASKFDKVIKSSANIDDIIGISKVMLGTETIGYNLNDGENTMVWIRTSQDVHHMFTQYFAKNLKFLQIVQVKPEQVEAFSKFKLRKEIISKGESAVFCCQIGQTTSPLLFLALPTNMGFQDAISYLASIFGTVSSLIFVDDCGDLVSVDSDESWEYCIDVGYYLSLSGSFTKLIIQL